MFTVEKLENKVKKKRRKYNQNNNAFTPGGPMLIL